MKVPMVIAVVVGTVVLTSCGGGDNPVRTGAEPQVVEGEVTAIQNDIPVDGGVTLDIAVQDGGTERLLFPSLFTAPPPSEELLRLYDVVRRVEIGDVVRAEGERNDNGLALQSLWILDGRP